MTVADGPFGAAQGRRPGGGACRRHGRGGGAAARHGQERPPVCHRDLPPSGRGGRQALPAAAGAARLALRRSGRPGRRPRRGRGRADPPGDALPRRRDGRGGAAPGSDQRERALGQHGGDPHRRLPVRAGLATCSPISVPRPSASRPGPSSAWSPARSARRWGRRTARTRSSTTCPWSPTRPRSLIATSGRFGALLSGADEQVVDVLARFGERIGVAFQLADDVLDVASDSVESGKMPGTDLREGVRTLPVLHALRSTDPRRCAAAHPARRGPHR